MPKARRSAFSSRTYTRENLKQAVQKILSENVSIRSVALTFKIPRMTLQRYLQKAKVVKDLSKINFGPRNEHLRIFRECDEALLRDFFLYASRINHGLSIKEGRRFVYEFAVAKGLPVNPKWGEKKMAPYDWFYCFMKRHQLSLLSPEEATRSCQRDHGDLLFERLRELLQRYQTKAQDWNRKNGVNNFKSFKVIARKVQ